MSLLLGCRSIGRIDDLRCFSCLLRSCVVWTNNVPKFIFHEKYTHLYLPYQKIVGSLQLVWFGHRRSWFYTHDAWNMEQLFLLLRTRLLLACWSALKFYPWLAWGCTMIQLRRVAMTIHSCISLSIASVWKCWLDFCHLVLSISHGGC